MATKRSSESDRGRGARSNSPGSERARFRGNVTVKQRVRRSLWPRSEPTGRRGCERASGAWPASPACAWISIGSRGKSLLSHGTTDADRAAVARLAACAFAKSWRLIAPSEGGCFVWRASMGANARDPKCRLGRHSSVGGLACRAQEPRARAATHPGLRTTPSRPATARRCRSRRVRPSRPATPAARSALRTSRRARAPERRTRSVRPRSR